MWILRLCAALAVLLPLMSAAQTGDESIAARLDRWDTEARTLERRLEFDPPSSEEIEGFLEQIGDQLEQVPGAREDLEDQLGPLRDQRTALGEPPEDVSTEAPQIGLERKRLSSEIGTLESFEKRIDQAEARAKGLEAQLADLRRSRFTEALYERGPSIFETGMIGRGVAAIKRTASGIALETRHRITAMALDAASLTRFALPLLLLGGGVVIALKLRALALEVLLAQASPLAARSRRVAVGAGVTLVRLILPVWAMSMILAGLLMSGLFGGRGELLLHGIGEVGIIVIGAYALGGAFYAPAAASLRLSRLSDTDAKAAHRWLVLLAAAVGVDRLLVDQMTEIGMGVEGLALLNVGVLLLGGTALWRYARYLYRVKEPHGQSQAAAAPKADDDDDADTADAAQSASRMVLSSAKIAARVAAVAAPALALLGYFAASRYAFYPLVFSGAVIGLCFLLFHVVQAIVQALAGQAQGGAMARLRLVPVMVGAVLTCAALPILALTWGVAPSDLDAVWRRLLEGFAIGDVVISPVDFLLFLALVVVGFILTGRAKRFLRKGILPLTGLDTGGADAVAAGAGYIGIVITVLIAISATGVDLSNLAIVAGALSVGIGFGLQNIVNNFVSGVILLIERPIKAGDWIELPSGMGYVKTINVRSTEVETFDRASLFVPNSQLISENVINWTHSNLHGRIICKVGVEYGSDPRQVERILLEIARAHPLMLRRPAPYVLFRGFGADSLDFEIRGVLRDINWILNVQSDINYEIARRFQEDGIGIPFRQADISLKNPEEIGAAFRGAFMPPPAATPDPAPDPAPEPKPPGKAPPAGKGDDPGD